MISRCQGIAVLGIKGHSYSTDTLYSVRVVCRSLFLSFHFDTETPYAAGTIVLLDSLCLIAPIHFHCLQSHQSSTLSFI